MSVFGTTVDLAKEEPFGIIVFFPQYTEDPTFNRHGLTPVTVLEQATSGLTHLHSLNIGKMVFFLLKYKSLERFTFEWKNRSFR